MAKSTVGTVTITSKDNPDWGEHEMVKARTVFLQGDREWINARAVRIGNDDQGNPSLDVDAWAQMTATIAKMAIRWTLTKVLFDEDGEPIMNADGKPKQVPIPLSGSPDERLEAVRSLHEDDVSFIYERITTVAPKTMTEDKQESFLPQASPTAVVTPAA